MSKASEWSKRRVDAEREWYAVKDSPSWSCKDGGISTSVALGGALCVHVSDGNLARVSPDQALSLAWWIIDTFGAPAPDGGA